MLTSFWLAAAAVLLGSVGLYVGPAIATQFTESYSSIAGAALPPLVLVVWGIRVLVQRWRVATMAQVLAGETAPRALVLTMKEHGRNPVIAAVCAKRLYDLSAEGVSAVRGSSEAVKACCRSGGPEALLIAMLQHKFNEVVRVVGRLGERCMGAGPYRSCLPLPVAVLHAGGVSVLQGIEYSVRRKVGAGSGRSLRQPAQDIVVVVVDSHRRRAPCCLQLRDANAVGSLTALLQNDRFVSQQPEGFSGVCMLLGGLVDGAGLAQYSTHIRPLLTSVVRGMAVHKSHSDAQTWALYFILVRVCRRCGGRPVLHAPCLLLLLLLL